MTKLTVLMPCWKGAELLEKSLPNLKASFKEDSKIIVILNEYDIESIRACYQNEVEFICLNKNYGPLSVDFAKGMIEQSEYVANVNSDMYFAPGWDSELCGIIDRNYPATASCFLVEPFGTGNSVVQVDDLGEFLNQETSIKFVENFNSGKYGLPTPITSYTHPIICKTYDFLRIGGYSNWFDFRYLSGYGLDDLFPYRLKLLNPDYQFITSNKFCVYHGISLTNRKLPPEIKNRSGWSEFIEDTGMTIHDFRNSIRIFNPIEIK